MEQFINFFAELNNLYKLAWIFICMGFFFTLENISPFFYGKNNKWIHARTNAFFLLTTILINVFFGLVTVGIFKYLNTHHLGLLNLVELPIWLELIIAVLFLDFFAQFFTHYLLHKVKFLWRFHKVHHSDTQVDVTTGTRHHPGDYIIRETFSLIAIVLMGMPFAYYIFYRILTVFFTYLTHANLAMPVLFEKSIGLVFVTPRMHKFHHHDVVPWTDSNYGNMFSFWDRIFGTMVDGNANDIVYGVDVLDKEKADVLTYQFKAPFVKN
jgi:sterol desaturase/sphingolipid hydroxylase (fatty acid hydroxylase superfamily)